MLDHKESVAKMIGLKNGGSEIFQNRRDFSKTSEFLSRMNSSYELGDVNHPMQMYVSKVNGNVSELDTLERWQDYIMTQSWIDDLAKFSANGDASQTISDYRISYLSDTIQQLVKEHELNYHKQLSDFDESLYMDDGRDDDYIDALNIIGSMGKLEYGFYEMFKPIGRTTEKYIKVKMSTDGILDITGVVGLDDCEHWEWEHGSRDYLRSLNNGNQRYMLQLSRPINDLSEETPGGSVIWWKPDKPEPLEEDSSDEEVEKEDTEKKMRYFKPYETERMLRWFGTTYIPVLDIDNIYKCTVCSIPQLSDDVQSNDFHLDATNIAANGMDLARANIDNSTSLSLLTLAPKATIKVENHDERTYKIGQFLKFIVSGNQ